MDIAKTKSLLEELLTAMIDNPECLEVSVTSLSTRNVEVIIGVHPEDIGAVIGKGGKNINALRTILYAIAAKVGKLCFVVCEKSSLH